MEESVESKMRDWRSSWKRNSAALGEAAPERCFPADRDGRAAGAGNLRVFLGGGFFLPMGLEDWEAKYSSFAVWATLPQNGDRFCLDRLR